MIELKYSFEYFCSPIWVKKNVDGIFENLNIDALSISDNLKQEIYELDVIYQSTYNEDYPSDPKILPKDQDLVFKKRVAKTAERLSEELINEYEILVLYNEDHYQGKYPVKEEFNLLKKRIKSIEPDENTINSIGKRKKKYANMLLSLWNRYWENKEWIWESLPDEIKSRYDLLKPILEYWEKKGFIEIVLDKEEKIIINIKTIPAKIN